jgi:hypothetical protein
MTPDTIHAHSLGIQLDAPLPEPPRKQSEATTLNEIEANTLHDILRRSTEAGYTPDAVPMALVPISLIDTARSELAKRRELLEKARECISTQARRIAVLGIALLAALAVIAIQGILLFGRSGGWRAVDGL